MCCLNKSSFSTIGRLAPLPKWRAACSAAATRAIFARSSKWRRSSSGWFAASAQQQQRRAVAFRSG